jgi:hypothetical protein
MSMDSENLSFFLVTFECFDGFPLHETMNITFPDRYVMVVDSAENNWDVATK